MTVLTNGKPIVTPRGSVLSSFLPKPRPITQTQDARRRPVEAVRERVPLRTRLRSHAGAIKDAIVATAAFACGDIAAFEWHPWAGFLSIGLSLVLIDHAVDRTPEPRGDAE